MSRIISTLLCFAGFALFNAVQAADGIVIERIFGPESPGPYKHPASIEQLANGDFYVAYYGGADEYSEDTAVYGSRQKKGETQWSKPVVIADTPMTSEGNAVIWQAPNGWAWLFYIVNYGETWSNSRIQAKISKDGAQTWSDPIMLTFEEGTMVRNRPIVLNNGHYFLPIYYETGNDPEMEGPDTCSFFLQCDPKTFKWTETTRIKSKTGNLQPAPLQIDDNYLIAYCRRAGGYLPTTTGYTIRAESHDGGKTWSEGKDCAFPNPNSAVDFLKLKNGHLLLVYNDSMNERDPLTVSLSTDSDKTYPHKRNIIKGNEGGGDYAYPYAIQSADGKIHVIFTSHERTVINQAIFDESWVMEKK